MRKYEKKLKLPQWELFQSSHLWSRIRTMCLILTLTAVSTHFTYAQANKSINLELKNNSLKESLEKIESQTDYMFIYSTSALDADEKITLNLPNASIESALNSILNNDKYSYKIIGKEIPIKKKGAGVSYDLVKGRITDANGEPVIGATIKVKGETRGTVSDIDGYYSLQDISSEHVLLFSSIGYQSQAIKVNYQVELNVQLLEDAVGLEEVVVVGYGTKKKGELTGSAYSVKTKAIANNPNNQLTSSLQGLVPGLQVNRSGASGEVGSSGGSIQIRGVTSKTRLVY